jgi:hydrogenase maturation protease
MSGGLADRRPLVIGIGNADRADDAIGLVVANRLRAERALRDHPIITRAADMLALIDEWAQSCGVILIDAAAPRSRPGHVHRIDVGVCGLPHELHLSGCASTHAFGVAETIGLAQTLGKLPARFIIYAVEGARFEPGAAMTPAVAAAAETVAQSVLCELRGLQVHNGEAARPGTLSSTLVQSPTSRRVEA